MKMKWIYSPFQHSNMTQMSSASHSVTFFSPEVEEEKCLIPSGLDSIAALLHHVESVV